MKIVFGNFYFALEALEQIPQDLQDIYISALNLIKFPVNHNIIKIDKERRSVTLSNYPHLSTHVHPYLESSIKINLNDKTIKLRNESTRNPVILHRIELMLHSNNSRLENLKAITLQEEKKGLFDKKIQKYIGRRLYWNDLCQKLGMDEISFTPNEN